LRLGNQYEEDLTIPRIFVFSSRHTFFAVILALVYDTLLHGIQMFIICGVCLIEHFACHIEVRQLNDSATPLRWGV
jgi:hypothetical protein